MTLELDLETVLWTLELDLETVLCRRLDLVRVVDAMNEGFLL